MMMFALFFHPNSRCNHKYQLNKNGVGDPCGPKNCSWEDLECNYNGSFLTCIISLLVLSANWLQAGLQQSFLSP